MCEKCKEHLAHNYLGIYQANRIYGDVFKKASQPQAFTPKESVKIDSIAQSLHAHLPDVKKKTSMTSRKESNEAKSVQSDVVKQKNQAMSPPIAPIPKPFTIYPTNQAQTEIHPQPPPLNSAEQVKNPPFAVEDVRVPETESEFELGPEDVPAETPSKPPPPPPPITVPPLVKSKENNQSENAKLVLPIQPTAPAVETSAELCSKHKQELKFYCEDHKVVICEKCASESHKNHNFTSLDVMLMKYTDKVRELSDDLSEMTHKFDDPIKQLSALKKDLEASHNALISEIDSYFEDIKKKVLDRKKALEDEANSIFSEKSKIITKQLTDCAKSMNLCKESKCKFEELLSSKSAAKVMELYNQGLETLHLFNEKDIHIPEKSKIRFAAPDKTDLESQIASLGSIHSIDLCPEKSVASGPGLNMLNDSKGSFKISLYDTNSNLLKSVNSNVISVGFDGVDAKYDIYLQDEEIKCTYDIGTSQVKSFKIFVKVLNQDVNGSPFIIKKASKSSDFAFNRQFGSAGTGNGELSNPHAVTCIGNEIFVCDTGNQRIQVFDTKGKFLRKWGGEGGKDGHFANPFALSSNEDYIYVADFSNDRIQVFDKTGKFIKKWGTRGNGNAQFHHPVGIASSEHEIYVCDYENHRIQVFDRNGNFLRKWGSEGNGEGELNLPWGIAVDGEEVYVVERGNHRIQVFNKSGSFMRKWGGSSSEDEGLKQPFGICLSETQVFVSEKGNERIIVYDKRGRFVRRWGEKGNEVGQFNGPRGICISNGELYVTDQSNNRVQIFAN
jgi:DNA-binding beta-propeller fold protein YncE